MSCFAGKLKEYPSFSVDCFDRHNLDSDVYFLSHCHQDHMNGLDSPTFLNRLKTSQNVLVYCSETTRNILLSDLRYKHLDNYLTGLPVEHPTIINIKNELTGKRETICVTLLPAGHCIGSVMFLFEGNNGTVFYTGDFRLSKGDASRIPFFHSGDSIKDITSIYVDTTFCLSQMNYIPNREATKNAVLRLIKRWLSHGSNYYVSLLCKGMYGYEYLLKEVAIALKTKIHVSPERLTLYSNLPDMIQHFTTQAKTTKIHSCNWERDRHAFSKLPCGLTLPAPQKIKVMKIRASSMWFARRNNPVPIDCVYNAGKDFYRVVHSMHSSMEEIIDLVGYLCPLYVYPTVEPAGLYTIKQAQESLQRFTKFNGSEASRTKSSEENRFQAEGSVVYDNQSMAEEMPALYEDQKCSKPSWISPSNNLPSEEVLAQCKQLGLMDESTPGVPRRRRRRRNETPVENASDDENLFKDRAESSHENHSQKRRILQDYEEKNTKKDEVVFQEKIESTKLKINRRATEVLPEEKFCQEGIRLSQKVHEGSLTKSCLKLPRDVSSERTFGDAGSISSCLAVEEGLETRLGDAGIVKDSRCFLGTIREVSEYCIPASPGNEKPSEDLLSAMHYSIAQGDLLQVACLRDS